MIKVGLSFILLSLFFACELLGGVDEEEGNGQSKLQEELVPNYYELSRQSAWVGGYMSVSLVALWNLPPSVSQWYEKPELNPAGFAKQWAHNIRRGPIWDGDIRLFNAYGHIHAGAAYAVMCRDNSFSQFACQIYANAMSLLWEFGPEAFIEVPSWQDILMTGLIGARIGEQFFIWKKKISGNDNKIWGSKVLGYSLKFLLDPLGYLTRGFSEAENTSNKRDTVSVMVKAEGSKKYVLGITFTQPF